MTTLVGTPVSKFLALGILMALAALVWFAAVRPIFQSFADAEFTTAELFGRYERYRRMAGQVEAAKSEGLSRHQAVLVRGIYFAEQSIDVAAAKLQNLATEIVRNNQGQVQIAQRLASQVDDAPRSIAVSVSFSASNKSLTSILNQIRNAKPIILIESLAIRSNLQPPVQLKSGDTTSQGPFEDDPILNIDMQLKAFVSLGGRP